MTVPRTDGYGKSLARCAFIFDPILASLRALDRTSGWRTEPLILARSAVRKRAVSSWSG